MVRALISPWGALGLALLSIASGFVPALLDQADVKSPVLIYVFGTLAVGFGLGAIAAFIAAATKVVTHQSQKPKSSDSERSRSKNGAIELRGGHSIRTTP